MRITYFIFLICLVIDIAPAQEVICTAQDKEIFAKKLQEINSILLPDNNIGSAIVTIGKTFLDIPYAAKTLEVGTEESIVVNLRGLDCTTFVENILAFSLLIKSTNKDFSSYTQLLEKIRYRNGVLDGYPSRLHYFSDWIADNEKKGILRDITSELGGEEIIKEINFMSTHREAYPFLKDDQNYKGIKISEKQLNQRQQCFLPKDAIKANEHLIQSGDIIALTTSIKGLDITHTGIAIRENNGRIHLLHASTSGKVVISELPLVDYLKRIKNNTGIMVARPM